MRTLRTIGIVSSAAVSLLSATIAFAEGQATSTAYKNQISERRAAIASTTQKKIEVVREEAQTRTVAQREKIAERVADIQDKVKQQLAQRLIKQFENLNKIWTDHFMNLMDHYDAILQKIQDRANIAANAGKNIASTTAAIQSAKTAIASARTAVIAQAAETYTPDTSVVTTTTSTTTPSGQKELLQNLRNSFKNLHRTLFQDLLALRDGPMKNARKAVQSALQTLTKIPKVDEGNATTTVENSNQ